MQRLHFLIDTNVFIALDPLETSTSPELAKATRLLGLIQQGDHRLFVHPRAEADLRRDTNVARKKARMTLLGKYLLLPDPPAVTGDMIAAMGGTAPKPGGNNDVDNHHLAAVYRGAAAWLVTEDHRLIGKARRLGLGERVGTVAEAIEFLRALTPEATASPLQVEDRKAHSLDLADPIFTSLREDYPEFDTWFRTRCIPVHRDVFVIPTTAGTYAAVCIVKEEGPTLKLCTFKVAHEHSGYRYGELLLRAALLRCNSLGLDSCYVEVLDHHHLLVTMLEDFGFTADPTRTDRGELVLRKHFKPPRGAARLDPLAHHIAYGPGALIPVANQIFIVPVQPRWSRLLFPDAESFQASLFPTKPVANALRKAYLANAQVRSMQPGATLLFYLSQRNKRVHAVGVLEGWKASQDAAELAAYVGKRTVYDLSDITGMCKSREVLAMLFRQDRILADSITLDELMGVGLGGPPQSISTLPGEEAAEWLTQRLAA